MKIIVIVSDTLRTDHIAAYGMPSPWKRNGRENEQFIQTPNIDNLARQAAIFDGFRVGSYPTIPCRLDLFTGRFSFPTRGWVPLSQDDTTIVDILNSHNYLTELVFDTPPLADNEFNFTRGFTGWEWARGQHRDRWNTEPLTGELPCQMHKIKNLQMLLPYLRNASSRKFEKDWSCAKTFIAASEWLERNHQSENLFLWVDTWDPHEPFDAPKHYLEKYNDPSYAGEALIYPKYGRSTYMSREEINDTRARYAAKITLMDRWLGEFLRTVDVLDIGEETLLIFLSDHGHLFGEHDIQGKPTGPHGMLYECTTRIPLLIRHPKGIGAGERIKGFCQPVDLFPTILDIAGINIPDNIDGYSLLPMIKGQQVETRHATFSGRYSRSVAIQGANTVEIGHSSAALFDGWVGADFASEPITVTTADWSLIWPPNDGGYPELYNLRNDPQQTNNVANENLGVVTELYKQLMAFLEDHHVNRERLESYRLINEKDPSAGRKRKGFPASTKLFAIVIDKKHYAFLSENEARLNIPAHSNIKILETTLGGIEKQGRDAFVCIGNQYYWPEDVIEE